MPHIYHRISSSFNEDWFSEIEDIIEEINDKNSKLAVRAILVKCRLDRSERKIEVLYKWMRALNDSYTDLRESIEIIQIIIAENEQKISDLTKIFNNLKID